MLRLNGVVVLPAQQRCTPRCISATTNNIQIRCTCSYLLTKVSCWIQVNFYVTNLDTSKPFTARSFYSLTRQFWSGKPRYNASSVRRTVLCTPKAFGVSELRCARFFSLCESAVFVNGLFTTSWAVCSDTTDSSCAKNVSWASAVLEAQQHRRTTCCLWSLQTTSTYSAAGAWLMHVVWCTIFIIQISRFGQQTVHRLLSCSINSTYTHALQSSQTCSFAKRCHWRLHLRYLALGHTFCS